MSKKLEISQRVVKGTVTGKTFIDRRVFRYNAGS